MRGRNIWKCFNVAGLFCSAFCFTFRTHFDLEMNCNLNGSGPPCSDDYRQFWLLWEKKQQNSRLTNIQVSPSFIPLKANWVNLSLIDKNAVFHLNKMSHIAQNLIVKLSARNVWICNCQPCPDGRNSSIEPQDGCCRWRWLPVALGQSIYYEHLELPLSNER